MRKIASAALLAAYVFLAGCAGTPATNPASPYPRCGADHYLNADCYGGPP